MSRILLPKISLRPRYHATAFTMAARPFRDSSAAKREPMQESVKSLTSAAPMASTAKILQPPSQAMPEYVAPTALEIFLADNPGLKPFLLAGSAKERAINESAMAWAEICDDVYRLVRCQICIWRTGILANFHLRMAKWSGIKGSSRSKRFMEYVSPIDDTSNVRTNEGSYVTFEGAEHFGREYMPFFFIFGERFNEKLGYEMYLDDLRTKGEDAKVKSITCFFLLLI